MVITESETASRNKTLRTNETDMSVCVFDNPATMARECWQDKKLVFSCSYLTLESFTKKAIPAKYFFYGANIGPWKEGQLIGDNEAKP